MFKKKERKEREGRKGGGRERKGWGGQTPINSVLARPPWVLEIEAQSLPHLGKGLNWIHTTNQVACVCLDSEWSQDKLKDRTRWDQAPLSQGSQLPDSAKADNPGKLLKTSPSPWRFSHPLPLILPPRGKDSSPSVGPGPVKIPAGQESLQGRRIQGAAAALPWRVSPRVAGSRAQAHPRSTAHQSHQEESGGQPVLGARQPGRVPTSTGHAWPALSRRAEEPPACLKLLYSLKGTGVCFLKEQEGSPPQDKALPWPWRKGPAEAGSARHCPRQRSNRGPNNHLEMTAQVLSVHVEREWESKCGEMLTGAPGWGI